MAIVVNRWVLPYGWLEYICGLELEKDRFDPNSERALHNDADEIRSRRKKSDKVRRMARENAHGGKEAAGRDGRPRRRHGGRQER